MAAVSIPHLAGTVLRLWRIRGDVDRRVFLSFGLMNAAGGLAGTLLHASVASPVVRDVFSGLLVFAGAIGLTGLSDRLRFGGRSAWAAGFVSGGLGGFYGT